MSTDERDPEIRKAMAEEGATYFQDLVTFEDRLKFGPTLMLTDVIALVEQAVLARGASFYGKSSGIVLYNYVDCFTGHCISSFAGGTINMRAALGDDYRTGFTD